MSIEARSAGVNGYNPHSASNPNSQRRSGISASIASTIAALSLVDAQSILRSAYLSQISSSTGRFPCKPDRYAVVVSMPKVNFVPLSKEETAEHVAALKQAEQSDNAADESEKSETENGVTAATSETPSNTAATPATNGTNAATAARQVPTYYTRLKQHFEFDAEDVEESTPLPVYEDVSVSVTWATVHLCNIPNRDVNSSAAMLALSTKGFTLEDKGVPFVPVQPTRTKPNAHPNAAVETSKRGVGNTEPEPTVSGTSPETNGGTIPTPADGATDGQQEAETAPMRSSRRSTQEPVGV